MRTQEEIIKRIEARSQADWLGFEWNEYLGALTPENLETLRGTFLKDDADLSDWERAYATDDDLLNRCKNYMEFAWDKANNRRGISAGRSLGHYKAWLWMLGRDDFEDIDDYEFYGKDELVRICEFLGLDHKQWDDGIRSNYEPYE